ncbi:MAG: hypothetical protein GX576_06455 [Thauera phenolivorans]|uniref:Sulfate ABC transporter substrate-binding protein n=1 Tax=Thauera phenolivorans TaxID=1792543 RepID=A0A7X7R7D5_9RHOO|nr:hypothetical protein [Thauera phenolivorans]
MATQARSTILRRTLVALVLGATASLSIAETTLLNVPYDVSRELHKDINPAFGAPWNAQGADSVTVNQSHGGSSKQAVVAGLEADVVTMSQAPDIDILVERGDQEIIARHNFRPRDPAVLAKNADKFPPVRTSTVDEELGGWPAVQKAHSADGGIFDQIMVKR